MAHQSVALHFPQFPQFYFCACLENAVLKRLSHSVVIKYLCPTRHPHTSIYLRRTAWSYRYLWNMSTGRGSIQNHHCSPFPIHHSYRRKACLAVMAVFDFYYLLHSLCHTTFLSQMGVLTTVLQSQAILTTFFCPH